MRRTTCPRMSIAAAIVFVALVGLPANATATPAVPAILSPADGAATRAYTTTVKVGISTDTTQVVLRRNGVDATSTDVSGETSVTFGGVGLTLGANTFVAVARDATGEATSPPVKITVVGPVGRPRMSGIFTNRVLYSARPSISGRTGPNTTRLELWLNGRRVRTIRAYSSHSFVLRRLPLRYRLNRIAVVAANQFYRRSSGTYRVWRLDVSSAFSTVIVVDKSDRRVYFVRHRKLVVYYKCAIGKPSTPTPERVWRIDSKEYTDPSSAYGPRKMRLYARVRSGRGYAYERTNYAIHGTDTPSSIGHMASHGCIRLYSWAILRLFPMVPLHTMVVTRA